MVFALHQHESATGILVPPHSEPSPTSLSTLSLWLWVPCFMYPTCTGHLFYTNIWNASHICVSALHRSRADLCFVPVLVYVLPKQAPYLWFLSFSLSSYLGGESKHPWLGQRLPSGKRPRRLPLSSLPGHQHHRNCRSPTDRGPPPALTRGSCS